MKQQKQKLDHWEQVMKNAIDTKIKTNLLLTFIIQKMDQRQLQRNQCAYTTATKSYSPSTWNPKKDLIKKFFTQSL